MYMETVLVPAPLRNRIGTDASEGLEDMFAAYHRFATDRFERRLAEEIGALRVEMECMRGDVRADMARMKGDLMKWSLLLWISQFAAILGALSYMLPR
jgi:hypothetical protein